MPFCKIDRQLTLFSFYHPDDKPGFYLEIYSPDPIKIKDTLLNEMITWSTVEHYYQAQKITNKARRQDFINKTKNLGVNDCRLLIQESLSQNPGLDSNEARQDIMLKALRAKYDQHPHVKHTLDATLSLPIVLDNAQADYEEIYWGCGKTGIGENMLGVLWMQIRAEKRDGKDPESARVEALKLQAQAKKTLKELGERHTLLQDHPFVFAQSTAFAPPEEVKAVPALGLPGIIVTSSSRSSDISSNKYDLVTFAQGYLKQRFPGFSNTITARNVSITYGLSQTEKNTFYIKGLDADDNEIEIRVRDQQIFENNNPVRTSSWANWAIRLIPQPSQQRIEYSPQLIFSNISNTTPGPTTKLGEEQAECARRAKLTVSTARSRCTYNQQPDVEEISSKTISMRKV